MQTGGQVNTFVFIFETLKKFVQPTFLKILFTEGYPLIYNYYNIA